MHASLRSLLFAVALCVALFSHSTAALNCLSFKHSRVVHVSNSGAVRSAIRNAHGGDLILMSSGHYSFNMGSDRLVIQNKKGSSTRPITLCGPRTAVIDNGGTHESSGMRIINSAYVNIAGITVQNGLKGIEVEHSTFVTIDSVRINNIGLEAIHINKGSSHNMVIRSVITNTGRQNKGTGEGVYIGSDDSLGHDGCYANHVLYNHIGPGVTAEMIDIKQFTSGGIIKGNVLDGRDLCGCNSAVSLINVKGNSYKVLGNIGRNADEDMFKVATTNSGQGRNNYFSGNRCLSGTRSGFFCVRVPDFGGGNTSPNRVACGQRSNTGCRGK